MSEDAPQPKTRKEKKKNQKTKGGGLFGKYSAKHARGVVMPTTVEMDEKILKRTDL